MTKIFRNKNLWLLLVILAIAAFFRFWRLADAPPGLYPDVAINGNDALRALSNKDFKLFYPENNGREGLFINLIAFSFWLFGANVWAIKIVPAVCGILTVWGIYLLTRKLFLYLHQKAACQIALLATFFTAVSFWHVNFSRLGFRAIMTPLFLVWSFYFLFKLIAHLEDAADISRPKILFFSLAGGALFGLGFHTYIAFRVAPLILIPVCCFAVVNYIRAVKTYRRHKFTVKESLVQSYWRDGWFGWDLFFIAIIATALPMVLYFWRHPADLMSRTGQISVMSADNPTKEFLVSAVKTLGQFVVYGDTNWRHNQAGSPQIFWPLIPLFLIGLGYSVTQICQPANWRQKDFNALQTHFTLIAWWGAMLAPSIMTTEGLPHSLRSIGAIPPSYIFTGLGGYFLVSLFKKTIKSSAGLRFFYILLFIGLASLTAVEFRRYFIVWAKNPITRGAFTQILVNKAVYLNSLPPKTNKYVFVNEGGVPVPYPDGLPMPTQTLIFLTDKNFNIKYLLPKNGATFQGIITPAILLPLRDDENIFNEFKTLFPSGRIETIDGFPVFIID